MPRWARSLAGIAETFVPAREIVPLRQWQEADDGLHERGLADAVAADDGDDLPRLDGQAHVAHDHGASIAGRDL